MKKTNLLIILWFLAAITSHSQNKEKKSGEYISIKLYRHLYNLPLTSKDSASFKIINKDTLIFIKNKSKVEKLAYENLKNKNKNLSYYQDIKAYMPIDQYKKKYKRNITEEDISNFKINQEDTLVLISNKDFYKNRVSVPYEPRDSTFLEVYKDVVFQKYSKGKNHEKLRMRYWKDDIKIYFSKNVNTKVKKEITKFAKYVSKEVDSLNISFVNKVEKSNYIIYGLNNDDDYNYEPKLKPRKVDYYLFWNGKQQIYNAKLQIDSRAYSNENDLILKSKKMFLNTLGYFSYTYKLPKESYFSLRYFVGKEFTDKDLEILKYHYSYGICKGTNLQIFEDQHERAIKLLKSHNQRILFVHSN